MTVSNAQHQRPLADGRYGRALRNGNGRHLLRRPDDRLLQRLAAGLGPVGFIDLVALIAQLLDVALRFALLRVLIQHPGVGNLPDACAHLALLVGMHAVGILLRDLRPVLVRGAGDLIVHLPYLCLLVAQILTCQYTLSCCPRCRNRPDPRNGFLHPRSL